MSHRFSMHIRRLDSTQNMTLATLVALIGVLIISAVALASASAKSVTFSNPRQAAAAHYSQRPLSFIANIVQSEPVVHFSGAADGTILGKGSRWTGAEMRM